MMITRRVASACLILWAGCWEQAMETSGATLLLLLLLLNHSFTRIFTPDFYPLLAPDRPACTYICTRYFTPDWLHWNQLLQHQMLNSKLLSEKSLLIQYLHQYLLQANLQLPTKDIICSFRDIFFRIQYFCNTFD